MQIYNFQVNTIPDPQLINIMNIKMNSADIWCGSIWKSLTELSHEIVLDEFFFIQIFTKETIISQHKF